MTLVTLLIILFITQVVSGVLGLLTDSYRLIQISIMSCTLMILLFVTAILQVNLG